MLSAIITFIIKGDKPYFAVGISLSVASFVFFISRTSESVKYILSLADESSVGNYALICVKALGISLLCSFVSDVCRELDSERSAQRAEFIGKAELIALSIPITAELVKTAYGLL